MVILKKVASILLITCTLIGFSGCASMTPRASFTTYHDANLKAGNFELLKPEINVVTTAEIGSSMFEKVKQYNYDTYNVHVDDKIAIQTHATGLLTTSEQDLGVLRIDPKNGWKGACIKSDATGYTSCLVDSNNDSRFDKAGAIINSLYSNISNPIIYTLIRTKPTFKEDSFKYSAYYQGKKGNLIKISFREYLDNIARPAFTQDIDYELDNNGKAIVGFKGLRMEIIKATNLDIKYKVLRDYD